MFDVIAAIVAWFYSLVPSYGFAIIMLTLTVMIVVTPLTLKGTRSMLQMQLLQPELKRIQSKYGPGERAEMNEELMKFYQENGINPLGGCLPLLVQLPVFLVLFRVVQGMTRRATDLGTQLGWTSGRDITNGPYDSEILDVNEHVFDPQYLPKDSEIYSDLTSDNEMMFIGIDLSRSAANVLSEGIIDVLPYLALIVVVLFSSLYQQRQIQGRSTGAQINPQQQMIMKIMPYFLPVFSWAMPAALVVYFVVSNLYRIGQQAYITHSLYSHDHSLGAKVAEQRKNGGDRSGGDDKGGAGRTEGKGRPTPKRSEARGGKPGSAKAKQSSRQRDRGRASTRSDSSTKRDKRGGGRVTGAKGSSSSGGGSGKSAQSKSGGGRGEKAKGGSGAGGGKTKPKKPQGPASGAGRTGRAPTRHSSGGGSSGSDKKNK